MNDYQLQINSQKKLKEEVNNFKKSQAYKDLDIEWQLELAREYFNDDKDNLDKKLKGKASKDDIKKLQNEIESDKEEIENIELYIKWINYEMDEWNKLYTKKTSKKYRPTLTLYNLQQQIYAQNKIWSELEMAFNTFKGTAKHYGYPLYILPDNIKNIVKPMSAHRDYSNQMEVHQSSSGIV